MILAEIPHKPSFNTIAFISAIEQNNFYQAHCCALLQSYVVFNMDCELHSNFRCTSQTKSFVSWFWNIWLLKLTLQSLQRKTTSSVFWILSVWSVEGRELEEPRTAAPEPAGSSEGICDFCSLQTLPGQGKHWAEAEVPLQPPALLGWLGLSEGTATAPGAARTHSWPAATGSFAHSCPSPPKRGICQSLVLLYRWHIFSLIILKCLSHVYTIGCCGVIFQWETCWVFSKAFLFSFFFEFAILLFLRLFSVKAFVEKLFSCVISESYPTRHSYLDTAILCCKGLFPLRAMELPVFSTAHFPGNDLHSW